MKRLALMGSITAQRFELRHFPRMGNPVSQRIITRSAGVKVAPLSKTPKEIENFLSKWFVQPFRFTQESVFGCHVQLLSQGMSYPIAVQDAPYAVPPGDRTRGPFSSSPVVTKA